MTNYNDGKWYGWNGGRCPVHPKSVVVVATEEGMLSSKAEDFGWNEDDTPIVAFLVLKPHREPLELWVNVYENISRSMAFFSQEEAEKSCGTRGRTVHMQEVGK